ncbi:TetR/AcrR family transcriptional regulator, partial [Hyphomonas sp.]|uniref:TetR/AcrR family transcriptional regulator n=1 Tax=Hyphomonas sp. TaxID=87 RepID=UPI0039194E9A
MARPREFDREVALDAATQVFRARGHDGASTAELTRAMQIGKQSLYDTFGDKWQLYLEALARDVAADGAAHRAALSTGPRALDGLEILLARVRATAAQPGLGLGAALAYGREQAAVSAILDGAERALQAALAARVRQAQAEGDVAADLDAREAAAFLVAGIAG